MIENAFQEVYQTLGLLAFAFLLYVFVYKSALALVWWRVIGKVLEPLGFRLVCRDMSFGIYAVRYKGREKDA